MARWRTDPVASDLRWTDPDGWHVTLAFLGAIEPARVPQLIEAAEGVARSSGPFRVAADRVGAFPRPAAAQTVWLGFRDVDGRLAALARAIQDAVLMGVPGGTFRAHLTLARSQVRGGQPLGAWLSSVELPTGTLTVRAVTVYRSHLGRGAPRYEALARMPLGGAGSGRD